MGLDMDLSMGLVFGMQEVSLHWVCEYVDVGMWKSLDGSKVGMKGASLILGIRHGMRVSVCVWVCKR